MKKNATAVLTLALLVGFALPVAAMAQVSLGAEANVNVKTEKRLMSDEGKEERRARIEARVAEIQSRVGSARGQFASSSAEAKVRIETNKKERVTKHTDRIYGMLTASLDRLDTFEGKIEARLDELASAGVDVSLTRSELALAADARVDAAASIADLKADLALALEGETSKAEVMALVRTAREELASVRQAYAQVLVQLRADVKASKQ